MIRNSMPPPPGGPAYLSALGARPGQPFGRALLAAVLVIAGSAVTGVVGGLIWAAMAPRVQYQVYTLSPPTAYATNPETSAFIAADGLYCFIAIAGGALIGLIAYLFAIRKYGPVPMAGAVLGAIAAAFLAAWIGHEASGGPGFDHLLATSKPGSFLYAPITLGSHGALAFWPLAAAVVAGGIELTGVLKARRRPPAVVPMPGMESFGMRAYAERPYPGEPYPGEPYVGRTHPGGPNTDVAHTDGLYPGARAEGPYPDAQADGPYSSGQSEGLYPAAHADGPYPDGPNPEAGEGPGHPAEDGRRSWAPAARPSAEEDRHPGLPHLAQNRTPPDSESRGVADGPSGWNRGAD
jgi:hypothetical protein